MQVIFIVYYVLVFWLHGGPCLVLGSFVRPIRAGPFSLRTLLHCIQSAGSASLKNELPRRRSYCPGQPLRFLG